MAKKDSKTTVKLESAFSLFSKSSEMVMKNLSLFAPLYAIPFVVELSTELAQATSNADSNATNAISSFSGVSVNTAGFGGLAILIFGASLLAQLALYILQLKVAEGTQTDFGKLWKAVKHYGVRLIGLGFCVGILFVLGLILFIVPGLIVLRRYYLSPYYMIDKDLSITDAMRASAKDSIPFATSIWGVLGVTVLISLTSLIPLAGWLIALVLSVFYSVASAIRYQQIKAST